MRFFSVIFQKRIRERRKEIKAGENEKEVKEQGERRGRRTEERREEERRGAKR